MSYPYVYKLTHKTTNQFYIGFRSAHTLEPEQDILIYKSSSRFVKEIGFDNFNAQIVAMFLDKKSAYDFEQKLIYDNWNEPGILNRTVFLNGKSFLNIGHSEDTRRKMSATRLGVKKNPASVEKMRHTKTGKHKPSGRDPRNDPVAITNINSRIKNFSFKDIPELTHHLWCLSNSGMSNVSISKYLNISGGTIGRYKKMYQEEFSKSSTIVDPCCSKQL